MSPKKVSAKRSNARDEHVVTVLAAAEPLPATDASVTDDVRLSAVGDVDSRLAVAEGSPSDLELSVAEGSAVATEDFIPQRDEVVSSESAAETLEPTISAVVVADPARTAVLTGLEQARELIKYARTVDEAKGLLDRAEMLRIWAKKAQMGLEIQNECAELRMRAERRIGEITRDLDSAQGARTDLDGDIRTKTQVLRDAGISNRAWSGTNKLASIPDEVFEAFIREAKANGLEINRSTMDEIASWYKPKAERVVVTPSLLPDSIKILLGDANNLEVNGQHLPSDSIALIVTSPPYGLDKEYADNESADDKESWEPKMRAWLTEMLRVCRGRLALNIPLERYKGGNYPSYARAVSIALECGWKYQSTIIWDKGASDGVSADTAFRGSMYSQNAPLVHAFVEVVPLFYKYEWNLGRGDEPTDLGSLEDGDKTFVSLTNGFWKIPGENRGWEGHPAPYPVTLAQNLIKLLSFPGDLVLDPFSGSGTTAIAAYRSGRKFIGFDISPEYVDSARRRLYEEITLGANSVAK